MLWRSVALAAVWTGASCYAQRNTQINREVDISGPIVRGRTTITATGKGQCLVPSDRLRVMTKLYSWMQESRGIMSFHCPRSLRPSSPC